MLSNGMIADEADTLRAPHEQRLTIEHLRSFVALAEELHFARAAARLYVSASPFSKRIKDLESFVGAPLVQRTTRSVELTDAGTVLLPHARDLVRRFDSLRWVVRDEPSVGVPLVRIGLPPGGTHPSERTSLVGAVKRAIDQSRVTLETVHPGEVHELLSSGALHLAVVNSTSAESDLESVVLRIENYAVAFAASDPMASRREVRLESISHMRYATIDIQPPTENQLQLYQEIAAAGVQGDTLLVDDVFGLGDVVATQNAFAFVPMASGSPYTRALDDPEIAIRPLAGFALRRFTLAVWLPERAVGDRLLSTIGAELRKAFPPINRTPSSRRTERKPV